MSAEEPRLTARTSQGRPVKRLALKTLASVSGFATRWVVSAVLCCPATNAEFGQ